MDHADLAQCAKAPDLVKMILLCRAFETRIAGKKTFFPSLKKEREVTLLSLLRSSAAAV